MEPDQQLQLDALVRALAVNNGRPVCLFLGAGASISSGMPSAQRCVWEWKQEIFSTRNPRLRESVGELSLPGTKKRIQTWLDQLQVYPPDGDVDEYSFYAQECYPTSMDRSAFFHKHVSSAKPHLGYNLLPLLGKSGFLKTVWTTNFDNLVARAFAAQNATCIDVGLDSAHRAARPQSQGEIRVVSLHGDYRYDELKNTDAELRSQDEILREELLHEVKDYDLIVVGYSGRDVSIMDVLEQAYKQKNPCRLFWCGFGAEVPDPVRRLLQLAHRSGSKAYFIPSEGFDDLVSRIALRQLNAELLEEAKSLLGANVSSNDSLASFVPPSQPPTSIIKGNAYPVAVPSHVLKIPLRFPPEVKPREWLESKLPAKMGTIVGLKDCALAFAESSDVIKVFDQEMIGNPVSDAITEVQMEKDLRILSLVSRTLVQSIAVKLDLDSDARRRVWEKFSYDKHVSNGVSYRIHRAMSLRLEVISGKAHVAIMPEVVATFSDGQMADLETTKAIRIKVYGYQHNQIFDRDINYWISQIRNIDLPVKGGGVFRIGKAPIYAGLFQRGGASLTPEVQRHIKQRGVVVSDADLVFSSQNGAVEVRDPNPLRGLVKNRPWDYQLTSSGLSPSVEIAMICPTQDVGKMRRFLSQFQESSQPSKSELDYLQPFPGFSVAFGIPLTLPSQGENGWAVLDDSGLGDGIDASKLLAQRICKALDLIRAVRPGAVVAIFVPDRWVNFERAETQNEHFDLHHFVKSYAARHGQSTQFVREKTALSQQACRVRWWLSLALYSKAQRTPWRLDCLDDDTAFVGIGYGMDGGAERGRHILLGCSHLYNSRGEGLQFRLGRIESPIIRGRNPYMSIDDARRTGDTIRQLFYDARMRLPTRVVIHKRTPFIEEERKGFLQGLEGIDNVELIEITVEESLRYLASKLVQGKPEIDKFPVPRGAAVILNSSSALLWLHGVTPSAQNSSWKYYQGKRRIPTPLLIRRYSGKSDLTQIATEILGLSKMNWNTFDYYSRLPATLDSASAIARMGPYLSGFGYAPYDYRLLI